MVKWQPVHGKPLVCVTWRDSDSSAPNEAFYEEDINHHARPMETYGLLMKQDAEGITVMTEFYQEDDDKKVYRGRTLILAPLVVKVEVLAEPWVKKSRKTRKIKPQIEPITIE